LSKKTCRIAYRTSVPIYQARQERLDKFIRKLDIEVNPSEVSRRIESLLSNNNKIWESIETELIKDFKKHT